MCKKKKKIFCFLKYFYFCEYKNSLVYSKYAFIRNNKIKYASIKIWTIKIKNNYGIY